MSSLDVADKCEQVQALLQDLNNIPWNALDADNAQEFEQLPFLIQDPWNNPDFEERRQQLEISRKQRWDTRDMNDPNSIVVVFIQDIRELLPFIEYQLITIHGDVNYYDQFDDGALSNLLNVARTLLSEFDNSQDYTLEFMNNLTVFEGVGEMVHTFGAHRSMYFDCELTDEQKDKIAVVDYLFNGTEINNCLYNDMWTMIATFDDLGLKSEPFPPNADSASEAVLANWDQLLQYMAVNGAWQQN